VILRPYETTFIVDGQRNEEQIEAVIAKIQKLITDNGGVIRKVERWGRKRLAYPIQKKQYGFYTHIRFDTPPVVLKFLQREYQLNEAILRYLTVMVDKRVLSAERQAGAAAAKTPAAPATSEASGVQVGMS